MDDLLLQRLSLPTEHLYVLNAVLTDSASDVLCGLLEVVARYGTPEEINRRACAASELPALLARVEEAHPAYLADLGWLAEQRDAGAFIGLACRVSNLSAKHEGGDPEVEQARSRPSDIRDYYRGKSEILASGDWPALTRNFYDKVDALNRTARALTLAGIPVVAARRLHSDA